VYYRRADDCDHDHLEWYQEHIRIEMRGFVWKQRMSLRRWASWGEGVLCIFQPGYLLEEVRILGHSRYSRGIQQSINVLCKHISSLSLCFQLPEEDDQWSDDAARLLIQSAGVRLPGISMVHSPCSLNGAMHGDDEYR
jgi:hypothetical protein